MKRSVLIIEDERPQAEGLAKTLSKKLPDTEFHYACNEADIHSAIENRYFSVAIVDLRMDGYTTDGVAFIKKIIAYNPFAKIIIVSAFTAEYFLHIKDLLTTGRIIDVVDKKEFVLFTEELASLIRAYHTEVIEDLSEINSALLEFYSNAKNEADTHKKGELFEHFVSLLFQSIGFNSINKRVKDKSLNEVDLIIRNEIDDSFINKFGKYILVECKNRPNEKIDKNTFIVFNEKLSATNGLAELGVLATTGHIARNTYIEAVRTSHQQRKIIFLSNVEMQQLIVSSHKLDTFKSIIDEQVKDN
mgnify:FL=1